MKINDIIQVRYIGEDDPAKLRHGKVYEARVLKKNWYGIVDEMQDGEYAYPPEIFEIVSLLPVSENADWEIKQPILMKA